MVLKFCSLNFSFFFLLYLGPKISQISLNTKSQMHILLMTMALFFFFLTNDTNDK